jgi:hypothetical protein
MAHRATDFVLTLAHPVRAAQRRRLGWLVSAVILGHLALLASTQSGGAVGTVPDSPRAVQLRVLSMPPGVAVGVAPGPFVSAAPSHARPAREVQRSIQAELAGSLTDTAGDAEVVYLPRAALTVAPRAQSSIAIAYPYFDGEADHYTGEFELFIDNIGGVVRVSSVTPGLPGILVSAVQEAFYGARFSPGEREGSAVRSRIRIEVAFERTGP